MEWSRRDWVIFTAVVIGWAAVILFVIFEMDPII
jgi:hypothetical protein